VVHITATSVPKKGTKATYQKQLTQVEAKKAEFFKELRELELKIISGGLYVVHITATSVPKKGTKLFTWPETGYRLTQSYGYTTYSRRGAYGGAPHNGIDMAAGFGSEIKAIGAGKIVANGLNDGWGNWIAIQHENNMVSVYAHMSSLAPLKVGALVTQGQTIGYEGRTGNATGSHLHLSLYRDFFTYINDKKNQLYFNYFEGSLNPTDYM
jgi:murein DD-endopeptidase MepM/ murein hydrolase activator NlpD